MIDINGLLSANDEKPKEDKQEVTVSVINGLKVQRVSTIDSKLKVLIYGDSGVGKTTLAGSVSEVDEMMPALFVDVEGGTTSLSGKYDGVEVVRVKSWQEIQSVYNFLFDNPDLYKTVVLDSLFEIQKLALYSVMRMVTLKDKDRDEDIPSLREYGKILEIMRKMVRAYRDLDMHVIVTALAETSKDDMTGAITTKPMFTGKFANEIPAFMDFVFYLYAQQKEVKGDLTSVRRLLSQPTEKFVAKDRSGKLPITMQNPTFKEIYNTVKGK